MPVKTIDPFTVQQWLRDGRAKLIDVREPAEYRAHHIPGARNLPLSSIRSRQIPDATGAVVIHCVKGGRSASACEKLLAEMPELEVYSLAGGIEAWSAAGLPTIKGSGAALPLDRQVQLAIGLMLLAGSSLSYWHDIRFILIPFLLGLGLTMAGATGFCGLAMLFARAPWNR